MKKLKLLFTTLLLLCATVASAHDFLVDGIYYDITSETDQMVEVTHRGDYGSHYSNEYIGAVTIPTKVSYNGKTYRVTSIGSSAFYDCGILPSITIPESVTSIGSSAFYNCRNLTAITIPESVTSIKWNAFEGCSSLTSITIPESMTYIPSSAFYNCSRLTSITIPESVTSIGERAFSGCSSLTSITIPESVTSIGERAFDGCGSLTSITIPESVTSIGDYAFRGCENLKTIINYSKILIQRGGSDNGQVGLYADRVINIDEVIDGYAFKTINGVHYLTGYIGDDTELILPNNYQGKRYQIGNNAFRGYSRLTSITIPEGMTSIGYEAFKGCSNLKRATIPSSVTTIEQGAFSGTGLTSVTIPEGVTSLGMYAFDNSPQLTKVELPSTLTSIGNNAFENCTKLSDISIPNNVTSIGNATFAGCSSLTSITIPESVTSIGYEAFKGCSNLKRATIPSSVTTIEQGAFSGTGLTSVTIPEGVTSLGMYAFDNSPQLTKVELPSTLTSIGNNAFENCTKLLDISIPNNLTSIGASAFSECSSLTAITIPEGVTSIGNNAFYGCYNLNTIINNSNLNLAKGSSSYGYIAYYATNIFEGCTLVDDFAFNTVDGKHYLSYYLGHSTKIVLPESYNGESYTISENAFSNCAEILSLTIPANVEAIEEDAFRNFDIAKVFWLTNTPPTGYEYLCGKINYVSNNLYTELENTVVMSFLSSRFEVDGICFVPTSVADRKCCIVDYNPSACKGEVTAVDTVMYQGRLEFEVNDVMPYAFYKNEEMATLTLQNLGKIGESAFEGCSSLTSITIPTCVTSVEDYAFKGCSSLTEATFADRETLLPLGKQLFADSPLASLYLGAKIEYISEASEENSPFCNNRSLQTVVITNVESDIYDYEFYGCSGLLSAVVGDGVERIGRWAFSGCSSLTDFVFGSNVTSIGEEAFSDCVNMTNITGRAILPPVCGAQALDDINKLMCTLTVPERNLTSYQNAEQWKEFPFIEDLVTEDNYVTYVIDGEVYKTLLLTPGERIVAPYVADKDGRAFGGWDLEKYMQTITYPAQPTAMLAAARVATTSNIIETRIDLTNKLYTNAPCTNTLYGDQFTSWDVLLDNNPSTFFHSEYGNKQTPDLLDHYIRVDMGEGNAVSTFKFTYTTRFDQGGNVMGVSPKTIVVEGSNVADGSYTEITTLTDLSREGSYQYISDELGSESTPYRYIRFRVTANYSGQSDNGHPYFAISELGMWKIEHATVEPEPEPEPTPDPEPEPGYTVTMPIMPDEDITIYGHYIINTHTITYMVDGKVYETVEAESGRAIDLIEAPTKEGHTFSGWIDAPEVMPNEDITINGSFTANEYTITYKVDGVTYYTVAVDYGTAVTTIDHPEREGHTFSGWTNVPKTMPAWDIVISGSFTVNQYTITYEVDGEFYTTATVEYGTTVTTIDNPEKEGHTFSGWINVPETMPAMDVVISGSFTVNYYTITYMVDGETYQTQQVEYGTYVETIAEPTKKGYTFSGWTNVPYTMPAMDIVISGSFVANDEVIKVTRITLDRTKATLSEGETLILTATITPDNATQKTITWSSSKENVATVKNGVVTAISAGTTTITAKAGDKKATCVVIVTDPSGIDTPTIGNDELIIYDLTGRKIQVEHLHELPTGVYLINGRKVVIK